MTVSFILNARENEVLGWINQAAFQTAVLSVLMQLTLVKQLGERRLRIVDRTHKNSCSEISLFYP